MIKYSIITPNYNGFDLMADYFKSLENQTYNDFEVIIVDDCSTDDSYNKLLEYKKNSKLKLYVYKTNVNSGPGVARNIGINKSNGEYITFIDNDDWVEKKMLEEINNIIIKKEYDCVIYDYSLDFENKTTDSSSVYGDFNKKLKKTDAIRYIRNHSVCKFYKNSIIKKNNLLYPKLRRHEDIAFVGSVLTKCESFYYLKKSLYHYVQRKKSLSKSTFINESTLVDAYNVLKKNYSKKYEKELKEKSIMDLLYNMVLLMCKNNRKNSEIRKFIIDFEKDNPNWKKYDINNYIGVSKKIFLKLIHYKFIIILKILSFIHTLLGG